VLWTGHSCTHLSSSSAAPSSTEAKACRTWRPDTQPCAVRAIPVQHDVTLGRGVGELRTRGPHAKASNSSPSAAMSQLLPLEVSFAVVPLVDRDGARRAAGYPGTGWLWSLAWLATSQVGC
jgi:hypothetical protein